MTNQTLYRSGLSSSTLKQLQEMIINCDAFNNYEDLQSLFVDDRIYEWRNRIPRATNQKKLVRHIISYLYGQFNVNNENGLVLFLHVLKEDTNSGYQQRILELVNEIEQSLLKNKNLPEHTKQVPLTQELIDKFRQGQEYDDYSDAFRNLENTIERCLSSGKNSFEPKIELKLMAVAMTFSWNFITSRIPKILAQYPQAHMKLEVLWVDPDHLECLNLASSETNWVETSRQRKNEVNAFKDMCEVNFRGRISFSGKLYQNIPHWHGWLVNNEYLFLGRTNWQFRGGKPKLLVGQNKYRYFDVTGVEGDERIQMFKHWHKYYSDFGMIGERFINSRSQ